MINEDAWRRAMTALAQELSTDPEALTLRQLEQVWNVTSTPARRRVQRLIAAGLARRVWKAYPGRQPVPAYVLVEKP